LEKDEKILLAVAVIFLSSLVILPVLATVTLDTVVKLTADTSNDDRVPAITSNGTNVYVTWFNSTDGDIMFTNSTDSGATFFITRDVGNAIAASNKVFPQIAVYRDNVHIVWSNGTGVGATTAIYINTSNDNGFTNATSVNRLDHNATKSIDPDIAISEHGNVYVTWRDQHSLTENDIMFRVSTNNGTNFDARVYLQNNTSFEDPLGPQVAASGDYVHVVWQNNTDILVRSSANNGTSFATAVDLADVGAGLFEQSLPQIASSSSGKNVFVTFSDSTSPAMFLTKSTDFGATFSTPTNLGTTGIASLIPSQLLTSGNNVYIVWIDETGNDSVQFIRSFDQGANFDAKIDLSGSTDREIDPRIAVDDTNVYVTWSHKENPSTIRLASSGQGGAAGTFTLDPVSGSTTTDDPAVAASSGKVFLAWEDNTDGGSNNIFYKTGTLSGADIQFNATQYKLGSTLTLTITDADSNKNAGEQEIIKVNVTSTTTPGGNNPGNYITT